MKGIKDVIKEVLEARFAQPLKKVLETGEAYEILDATEAQGGTWCAGGCAILAHALQMLYGYDVWIIYDHDNRQIDHFAAKTPKNTFVDCDGEQLDILRNFRKKEHYMNPGIQLELMPYDKTLRNNGIAIDMQASRKLAEYLKQALT
jgi:hypothetical protein